MNICFWGTYDKNYSSNKVILTGLRQAGATVVEVCNHTPITNLNSDAHTGFLASIKRILHKFSIIPITLKNWSDFQKSDIIWVGYPGHFDLLLGWVFAKLSGKKLVFYPLIILYITFTEDVRLFTKESFKAKLLLFFERFIYKLPDHIYFDIPFQNQIFKELLGVPEHKLTGIPIGADDSIYHYNPIDADKNVMNVVYYGLYSPLHGVEHILDAAKLCASHSDIKFLMVGKGQTFPEFKKFAENNNLTNVVFMPDVTESNAKEILESADAFFGFLSDSPTIDRSFPNKLYQGFALGKPVITSDSKAARAVFNDRKNIILVKPASGSSIAEAILELKANPKLRVSIAQAAHEMFVAEFTPQAIGAKLLASFEQIIKK